MSFSCFSEGNVLGNPEHPADKATSRALDTDKARAFDTPLTQVNSAQTRIINRLQTSKISGSRPIAGVPLVVVEATAKQLDQLVANGEIAELFEDRISQGYFILKIALSVSRPNLQSRSA